MTFKASSVLLLLFITSCSNSHDSKASREASLSALSIAVGGGGKGFTPSSRVPAVPHSSTWDRLRVGLRLYTGDDGGGATKLTVCPSLAQYFETLNGETPPTCTKVARGIAATVEEVIPTKPGDPDFAEGLPHVKVRAINGAWSGFAPAVGLQPAVPIGTTLIVKSDGDRKARLAPRQGSDTNAGPELSDGTRLRILHFFPDTGDRPLYVSVLSGDQAGRNGWIFADDGKTDDGGSPYVLDVDVASPEPTINPLKRTYTLTDTLRVFNDVQVCKDVFNAMHDRDAYKRVMDAANSGEFHDFDKGSSVHIVSDPDPNDLWVIVADDDGNQGCVSRYRLPGY